jgi:hypothetical protein
MGVGLLECASGECDRALNEPVGVDTTAGGGEQ